MFRNSVILSAISVCLILFCGGTAVARAKEKVKSPPESTKTTVVSPECKQCVREASSLFAQGKNMDALELLKKWQPKCRNSEGLHMLMSTILLRMKNRPEEAAEAARIAVTLNPKSVAANLLYATCLLVKDDKVAAAEAFEQLLKIDPTSYEAWSALSQLYTQLGNAERARVCGNKAGLLEPGTRDARLRVFNNLKRAGKHQAIAHELQTLIHDEDLEPEFFVLVAREALSAGAYSEAVDAANRVLKSYPDNSEMLSVKATTQLWQREYKGVLKTLEGAGDSPEVASVKAIALIQLGKVKEAKALVDAALAGNPRLANALFAHGLLAERSGEFRVAMKALQASIAQEQVFSPAHIELARIYLQIGDEEKALEEAREIGRVRQYIAASKAMEARVALAGAPARDRMKKAINLARIALRENENDPEALIAVALCELKGGDLSAARPNAIKAQEIEPGNLDALMAVSQLAHGEGDNRRRLDILKQASTFAPSNGELLLALSQAYIDAGDLSSPVKALKNAASMNKSDPVLAFALGETYDKNSNDKLALKWFQQSLDNGLKGRRAESAREAIKRLSDGTGGAVSDSL